MATNGGADDSVTVSRPARADSGQASVENKSRAEYDALVRQFLADDRASVSANMVNVLSQDKACALFTSYITRLAGDEDKEKEVPLPNGPRAVGKDEGETAPREIDDVSDALRLSYRATMLLTNEDSSDALITFLADKSKLLTKSIFQVFQPDSHGNLRHGCRVLDYLMRLYLDDVYEVLGKDAATVQRYMGAMLNHIEHAPVAEVFLSLVAKPHNAALMRYYSCTPPKKWGFYRALSEWKVLLVLGDHVSNAAYAEAHTIGAADVFIELIDRLAADDNGELLLQPAAYCPELVANLVSAAVDRSGEHTIGQRTAAIKCLHKLLHKSTLDKVQGPPTSPYQSFGATIVNLMPNQLAPLREKIFELAELHLVRLLRYLIEKYEHQQNIEMDLDSGKPLPAGAVRHTGYVVKVPFTEYRLTLVESIVEIVSHNPSKLSEHFDANVWRVLLAWFFEYAHNNLYHAAFYHLVFLALRTDNQTALEVLVKKLKLVSLLVEHYRNDAVGSSNKGYILQLCNAVRLQAASQSPEAFLRNFLQSHTIWRSFEPELRGKTSELTTAGLGFNVPQPVRHGFQKDSWQPVDEVQDGIDHGSEFARSLGFVDDVAWPEEDAGDSNRRKKKKKKGKKGKHGRTSNADEDGDGESDSTDPAAEEEEEGAAHSNGDAASSEAIEELETNGVNGRAHSQGHTTPKKKKTKKKHHKK